MNIIYLSVLIAVTGAFWWLSSYTDSAHRTVASKIIRQYWQVPFKRNAYRWRIVQVHGILRGTPTLHHAIQVRRNWLCFWRYVFIIQVDSTRKAVSDFSASTGISLLDCNKSPDTTLSDGDLIAKSAGLKIIALANAILAGICQYMYIS